VALPSKKGHVSPKAFHTAFNFLLLPWMEILTSQSIFKEVLLETSYTTTKLRDSEVASRGGYPGVALQPLTEHQHSQIDR
jgi:hypothetical protein